MGIPHLAGRDFAAPDRADSNAVAILSESAVKRYFGDEDPIDKRLHINTVEHANGRDDMEWIIVGIVRDVRSSVDATAAPIVYVPFAQIPSRDMRFFIRAGSDAMLLAPTVTRVVQSVEREAPVDVRRMDDIVAGTIARPQAMTVLVSAFALFALALAAVGVYGVIAYSVRARRSEIGVRVALGATAPMVGRLILARALRLVGSGVVIGLAAAAALTRLLERMLFEVEPLDTWTFAFTPVILAIIAFIASYVPTRRAMQTPPTEVLRGN
jgi:putative ABC transport system permease protein